MSLACTRAYQSSCCIQEIKVKFLPQSALRLTAAVFKRDCRNMQILYKDKSVIAVNKAIAEPIQSDISGDADTMSRLSSHLRSIGENDALWLVHRLDRVVGGVAVFARTKRSAAALSLAFSSHTVKK